MFNKLAHLHLRTLRADIPQAATRDGFGQGLLEAGQKYKNVVALTADLTESTKCEKFKASFPDRFIQVGVAEQTLAGVAVGLALNGKIPFATSFSVFSPGRNWDQIRISACFNKANVKFAGSHAGLSTGPDGGTHQALEDIALTRVLPNMTVLVPADAEEARKAVLAAAKRKGPVYIRLGRQAVPVFTTADTPFVIGKALMLRDGKDVAVWAAGPLTYTALEAADRLVEQGISVRVYNSPSVKPLDADALERAAKECGAIVTCEEHQVAGGVGSAVAEHLSRTRPVPIEMIGMPDSFGESGQPDELMKKYHLNADSITDAVRRVMKRKR